ncbi:hypothetical protein LPJ61_005476 [Coemansia biformis]|uniref:Subtilisin-like protein n=1 Tax=Coemansia biformis TaxID=1286918 RepID=A0A9W7Y7B9_9FUNG|nr:hypothetical protein LPJ61_005476 [Coemansia biformis]
MHSTRVMHKWIPQGDPHAFVFESAVPVAAVKDATGSPLACNPVLENLTGKIALVPRGNCTFTEKAMFMQKAGAVGVLFANNDSDPIGPGLDNIVTIPCLLISKDDGEFILRGLAQGPVTASAAVLPYDTFKTDTGGQMSPFSSYGPTPDLNFAPLVSAPGGDIWSTFPRALGSYKSLSGTSMATPYVAGAVALLKQARPDLDATQIRQALIASAKPVTDPRTGQRTTPLASGAGLLNIYDAVKTHALISPPFIAINDTIYEAHPDGNVAIAEHTITITNMDTRRAAQLYTAHLLANSVTMFQPNGLLSDAVFNQLPLDTWPPNKDDVPPSTQPQLMCIGCTQSIAPGASVQVSVRIFRPTGLPESERWFYGGFLDFRLQWGGDAAARSHTVPYIGYNGDYRKIGVLAPASSGFPALVDMDGNPISNPAALTVSAKKPASIAYFLNMPTHEVAISLVSAAGKAVGYLPGGCFSRGHRTLPSTALSALATINGTVSTDCAGTNFVNVAPGKYHVQLSVLGLFGNPNTASDYETWDSELFSIA